MLTGPKSGCFPGIRDGLLPGSPVPSASGEKAPLAGAGAGGEGRWSARSASGAARPSRGEQRRREPRGLRAFAYSPVPARGAQDSDSSDSSSGGHAAAPAPAMLGSGAAGQVRASSSLAGA